METSIHLSPSTVPRNQDRNTVLDVDFDIELGNTADEAKDDPGNTPTRTRSARLASPSEPQVERRPDVL